MDNHGLDIYPAFFIMPICLDMNTLFLTEPIFPEGFSYFPGFITETEEKKLLELISKTEFRGFLLQGFEAKRKIASFGYDWSFEKQMLSKGKEIPGEFTSLIQKIAAYISISQENFAELLLTYYPVGSVINWHRDAPPFDLIAGISLLSDCIFKLRPHDKTKQNRKAVISFPIQRRSLYIIQGSARTGWQHSIAPVEQERYSITLRTLK